MTDEVPHIFADLSLARRLERVEALPDGHTLRLTVLGGVDAVVKAAARYRLVNLVSREPSLEDVFLRYYQGEHVADRQEADRVVS